MYQVIPEKVIKNAADEMRSEDPLNSFHFLIEEGELYKDAGLTPLYLHNVNDNKVLVTSKEYMSNKFH